MINHAARFMPHLTMKNEPFSDLLSKNVKFQRNNQHEEILKKTKDILCSKIFKQSILLVMMQSFLSMPHLLA